MNCLEFTVRPWNYDIYDHPDGVIFIERETPRKSIYEQTDKNSTIVTTPHHERTAQSLYVDILKQLLKRLDTHNQNTN